MTYITVTDNLTYCRRSWPPDHQYERGKDMLGVLTGWTLAADYCRAMNEVEWQLELVERPPQDTPSLGELVVLIDSLRSGTLNDQQANTVQAIRDGIMALARQEQQGCVIKDVKELVLAE